MAKFVLMLDVLTSLMILFGSCKVSGDQACGIRYNKIGCFVDQRQPFPLLLLNHRGNINWKHWNAFLDELVCECANMTASAGYTYFGIQFWGECWTGENPDVAYDSDGVSDSCFGRDFVTCDQSVFNCAGEEGTNYVYGITAGQPLNVCKDGNPERCHKYREFCSYKHVQKNCPLTCDLCRT